MASAKGREVITMKQRLLCVLLCLCMLLCSIPMALAADTLTGTVQGLSSGYLKIRKEAPSGAEVGKLYNGNVVTILDTVVIDNTKWHKVTYGTVTGWASGDFIKVNYTYENDADFEAYLTAQKFPEDYKEKLRLIHAEYPTWVFNAQHLSMTWAEALAAETKHGLNTTNQGDGWKSMEYGSYNWSTNTYVDVDGGYVTADPAVVAYFMDPRNFLDSTYVFQFENLAYDNAHTLEGVKGILPDRFDPYAEDLLKAAKDAKVNAYFLATRMTQEGSKIDGTLEGYPNVYNFFNIGAYAHSGRGAVTNGAIYAQNKGWTTPYKCILASAEDIGKRYINKGQNTLYYQKFNVVNSSSGYYINQYMTNVMAPYSESGIRAGKATAADKGGTLTFVIPVYKDMPAAAATKPATTGNNNNFLNSITVSNCTVSPTFNRYTLSYSGDVGEAVTSVTVSAVKNAADATVTGTGTIQLMPGENVIPIVVTATSGQTRTYTVTITRNADIKPEDMPKITGTTYSVGTVISKVQPNTSVAGFLSALAVQKGTAKLYTSAGTAKTDGVVATGDILRLYSGSVLCSEYPVVIHGDVNGDGKATSIDLRMIQKQILGVAKLNGYGYTTADVNRDGKISSIDLRMIQKYILGVTTTLG